MIKIIFNKKFRIFPKGYAVEFNSDRIVLVGDNGTGKSTLMLILLAKLFLDNNVRSLYLDNILGTFIDAIEDKEIIVETTTSPLPVIMDVDKFNNAGRIKSDLGGIAALSRFFEGSRQSTGEKKFEEVLDNIRISHDGFADRKSDDGTLLMLDEPDASLNIVRLLKLKKELESVSQYFVIYHNPYIISKEKEVYYLSLRKDKMAAKVKKISGKDYIKEQEKIFYGYK